MSRHWTAEAKEAARQRIYQNKPWIRSTGPRSQQGKAIASKNAMTFTNQVREGMWCYLPRHRVFARQDTLQGSKLIKVYTENNWLYGDRSFLVNGINQYGERWLDRLI